MNTWTHEDRAELERLIARKKAFYDEHRAPLRILVKRILDHVGKGEMSDARVNDTVLELELHADELRDLLKPFDSGQRPPTIAPCPTSPPVPVMAGTVSGIERFNGWNKTPPKATHSIFIPDARVEYAYEHDGPTYQDFARVAPWGRIKFWRQL